MGVARAASVKHTWHRWEDLSLSATPMCFALLSAGLISNRTKGLAHVAGYSPSMRAV